MRPIGRRVKRALLRSALLAAAMWALAVGAVNGAVRFVSGSGPFLLDPRHTQAKLRALGAYAKHRGVCLIFSDADVLAAARKAARQHGVDPVLFEALVEAE